MIKIDKTDVYGWETAIRGMRNAHNSWDKSDSGLKVMNEDDVEFGYEPNYEYVVGEKDLDLMKRLSKAGSDHAKYLRMINVTCDITAPRYWWAEYDTYKVGTVANSTSTMHSIHSREITLEDFSTEHLVGKSIASLQNLIDTMNYERKNFLATKDKDCWWQIIQLLPSSYNQKRTVHLNYQVLKNMYHARRNHKLDEWHTLCDWIEQLPYAKDIICLKD